MANEKRLIDANALMEMLKKDYCQHCDNCNGVMCRACWLDNVEIAVDAQPTVDAVEVVRCKDCKCGKQPKSTMFIGKFVNCALYDPMPMMRCNDFCSRGERRNDG